MSGVHTVRPMSSGSGDPTGRFSPGVLGSALRRLTRGALQRARRTSAWPVRDFRVTPDQHARRKHCTSCSVPPFLLGRRICVRRLEALVDLASMSDLDQDNHEFEVADLVHDPVDPLSHPVAVAYTSEFFAARWARVCRKALDASDDLSADLLRFDPLDLLRRRGLDSEAIASHFASSTAGSPQRIARVRVPAAQMPLGPRRRRQGPRAQHHSPSRKPSGRWRQPSASAHDERSVRSRRSRDERHS